MPKETHEEFKVRVIRVVTSDMMHVWCDYPKKRRYLMTHKIPGLKNNFSHYKIGTTFSVKVLSSDPDVIVEAVRKNP